MLSESLGTMPTLLSRPAAGTGRRRALAVLLAAVCLPALAPVAASAAPGTPTPTPAPAASRTATSGPSRATFGIVPATVGKGIGRPYFSYAMGVGGTYSDRVQVVNYGRTALDLSVFAADLGNAADGALAVGLQSAPAHDAGGWVHLPRRVQLVHVPPAGAGGPGHVALPFRIAVPGDAVPGDHAAAIVASLSTVGRNAKGENVRLDQRIATRVYLRIAGPLHPALVVEGLTATYHGALNPFGPGSVTVSYRVHNTGNVRLGARQRLSVAGWFGGTGAVPKLDDLPLLLPGSSVAVRVTVPDAYPQIRLHARVSLFPLKLSTDANPAIAAVTAEASTWALPWSLLAVVALVVLLVAGTVLGRRRRRSRPDPDGPARHRASREGALT